MKIKIYPVLTVLLGPMACKSVPSPSTQETMAPPIDNTGAARAFTTPIALEEYPTQIMEIGFCRDDIISRYVKSNAVSRRSSEKDGKKKNKSSLLREAEHEAHQRLNSHLPVLFDGIPIHGTQRVYSWVNYYTTSGRQEFLLWLIRSKSYQDIIIPVLSDAFIPEEIFLIAMIESGFSNTAFSRSSASGTWQFMKATARYYGLTVNYWVDERRDPIKATVAASRYLKDLHQKFGDWFLALAAYNAGPRKIARGLKASQSNDYWSLAKTSYIKKETKNYIPKLLAALVIASHPQHYGFSAIEDIRNTTPLTKINLNSSFKLIDLAKNIDTSEAELKRWNPELIRDTTPPTKKLPNQTYGLRIPSPFAKRLLTSQSESLKWRNETISQSASLESGEIRVKYAKRSESKSEIPQSDKQTTTSEDNASLSSSPLD